jgi:GNAT superfamily N-acetyltransferase
VAEAGGKAVGYIHAADYDCTYQPPMKNILTLVVDSALRGRGIGRRLLAAAEEWAKDDGALGVRLVSGFDRVNAHAFYLACGYFMRKEEKNFIKRWDSKA